MMQYFIDNNYVQFDLQKIAISAASRGDIEAIKHVQASEPSDPRLALRRSTLRKRTVTISARHSCVTFSRSSKHPLFKGNRRVSAKSSRISPASTTSKNSRRLCSATTKERAPTNYLKVLKAAFEGKGVIMNYGHDNYLWR